MLKTILAAIATSLMISAQAANFTTDGNAIRGSVIGHVKGTSVLFISELDGAISCYTTEGKKLWRNPSLSPAVAFEIEAVDLDGDGNEDVLAASGDGHITAWKSNGNLLWRFNPGHKVRFSEIAVIKNGRETQIFAGGNNNTLYKLNAEGTLVSSVKIEGVVRKIETGHFLKRSEESVFVMTYNNDKFRWKFLGFLDPDSLKVQRSQEYDRKLFLDLGKIMVTDISIADINQDGRDDLLFFGDTLSASSSFIAMSGEFKQIARFRAKDVKESKGDSQRYAHTTGISLLPYRNEVLIRNGRVLYVCDADGQLLHRGGDRQSGFAVNDICFDPASKRVFSTGAVSGGNGVYICNLEQPDWWKIDWVWQGRMQEVQGHLDTLYQQALEFTPPTYQQPAKEPWVIISGAKVSEEVKQLRGNSIIEVAQYTRTENFDRSEMVAAIGKIANKRDSRKGYKLTRKEIVAKARDCEKRDTPFVIWSGHGTDPFYNSIETLEAVAEAAPGTCYGFLYAEMHDPESPRVKYYLEHYLPRLVKACRKNGKAKIYFRFKNMFWATNVQMAGWKDAFFSGKYADVLVPAAEDTSSRTQDINFIGRVGMFAGGSLDDFAFRLIDDNPTSWRPLTPGTQKSASPYVRNGVLCAAYGARYGILFGGSLEAPGLDLLYALMASGVLPVVEKEQIASIGSWHLMQDIDKDWHHSIDDHHNIDRYSPDDDNAVISVAQMHWAGASLPEYDFSKVALGVEYRWLNSMPALPHGMVLIGPTEYAPMLKKRGIPFTVSNGKVGYERGETVSAEKFGPILSKAVEAGEKRLPILVSGAAWSAIKLDEHHYRVVLMDPHYLDPRNCAATVSYQGKQPTAVADILSKEKLPVSNGRTKLTIPAGSIRFIDVTF